MERLTPPIPGGDSARLGPWGTCPGTAMQSGEQQTSLWEQSDLLDLVVAAPAVPRTTHPSAQRTSADSDDQIQADARSAPTETAAKTPAKRAAETEAVTVAMAVAEAEAEAAPSLQPQPAAAATPGASQPEVPVSAAAEGAGPPLGDAGGSALDDTGGSAPDNASSAAGVGSAAGSVHQPVVEPTPPQAIATVRPPHQATGEGSGAAAEQAARDMEVRGNASPTAPVPPQEAPVSSGDEGPSDPNCESSSAQDPPRDSGAAESGSTPSAPLPPLPDLSLAAGLPACPERLLILDTETTALSPEQGQCIEVGAVLFDVGSRAVLMQVSFLLPCDHNPAQTINGIPAAVSRLNQPWRSGLNCFEAMVDGADALLAHNASFDRQWFGNGELPVLGKPWICSMEDIRWPAERQLRPTPSVRDLALAYGVPVWAAHRALTDCIYLVQVFQRCDELESLLQTALEPRRLVRARLSYDERQLAKDAGFRWNEPVPKAWSRRLSEREIAALPFPVDPVEAEEPGRQRRQAPQPLWRRSA